jgi:hypothetical protein
MNAVVRFSCCEVKTPSSPSDRVEPVEGINRWAAVRDILSPVSSAPIAATRLIPSTARRFENLKMVILELAFREMRADEIAVILKSSASGVRNYIIELCDAGVIAATHDLDGTPKVCKPYYRLSSNLEHVRAFAAGFAQSGSEGRVVARRGRLGQRMQVTAGMGRNFYIMADDVPHAVRLDREPVQRDPLVTALFGSPRRHAALSSNT